MTDAELFAAAVTFIVSRQFGSQPSLQRALFLNATTAERLMDRMEALGIVGPANGGKAREVLVGEVHKALALIPVEAA